MQALILVGGLGTRLRQVVNDRPKPMALVNSKPFLEYLICNLKSQGVGNFILAVGYMGQAIEEYFGDGRRLGIKIKYSYEKEQLGTAGAIKNAENLIASENLIVLNGDTFFYVNYKKLMDFHIKKASKFTMVLRKLDDTKRYGTVDIDVDGKILGFMGKNDYDKTNIINGGIYIVNKSLLECIPNSKSYSLENELMPRLISENINIYGIIRNGYFIDIGIPEDYYRFINDIKNGVVKC